MVATKSYPSNEENVITRHRLRALERQPRFYGMIYLEIAYAKKDEAKSFGVRWDPKEKLWYFPGDVLPKELERFRPANATKGPVEKNP